MSGTPVRHKPLPITLLFGAVVAAVAVTGIVPASAQPHTPHHLDVSVGLANRVNLAGPGVVPVTVLSTDSFDATTIDLGTVRLGEDADSGTSAARLTDGSTISAVVDVDDDARDDVVVFFDKDALRRDGELTPATSLLALSAATVGGEPVVGSDRVTTEVVLEVKFDESLRVRGSDRTLHSRHGRSLAPVRAVLDAQGGGEVDPTVDTPTATRLDDVAAQAEERSGQPVPDLASWYSVTLPADADADEVLTDLEALPEIEFAYPAPDLVPPPQVPDTPDFTGMQRYFRGADENGIDADFSRADPRLRGAGIKIVDWEYDWNEHHEDLQLPDPGTDLGGTAFAKYTGFNDQHGTAVMGILGAIDNDYGVTGGVPDAQLYGLSPTRASGAYAPGPSLAYLAALQDEDGEPFLEPGDAVLLEQQTTSPFGGTRYAPVEWVVSVHNAVTLLTSMGVTVVTTGGNGNTDSDHPLFTRDGGETLWFDRDVRDSGSIFVGAGHHTTRERLSFSNYGSRFDLQGWGNSITTTGHGGTSTSFWPTSGGGDPATLDYRYTSSFGGTSGAGPIVTTAVVAIQSYVMSTGQDPWSAQEIADVLKATGQPQGPNSASQHIGPLPDLEAALKLIEVDPPQTESTLTATDVTGLGWYVKPIVELTADDGWGSGVASTEYRVDGGSWTPYDGPVKVDGNDTRVFEYRSIDSNGNVEDTNTITFVAVGHHDGED